MNSHVIAYKNRKENKLYAVNDHKKFINNADPLIEKLELIYSKLKNSQDFHILYDDTLLMGLFKDTVKMDKAAAMSLICLLAESIKKPSKKSFWCFATKVPRRFTYKIKKIRANHDATNIKVTKISKQLKSEKCAICMDPIYHHNGKAPCPPLKNCNHTCFHKACLDNWLKFS